MQANQAFASLPHLIIPLGFNLLICKVGRVICTQTMCRKGKGLVTFTGMYIPHFLPQFTLDRYLRCFHLCL